MRAAVTACTQAPMNSWSHGGSSAALRSSFAAQARITAQACDAVLRGARRPSPAADSGVLG